MHAFTYQQGWHEHTLLIGINRALLANNHLEISINLSTLLLVINHTLED